MVANDSHQAPRRPAKIRSVITWLLCTALLVGAVVAIRSFWELTPATAQAPAVPSAAAPAPTSGAASQPPTEQGAKTPAVNAKAPGEPGRLDIVAIVNTQDITRDQLGKECLWHFGKEVLETMVNRRIIEHQCQAQHLTITVKDVDAEIDRMAQRFGIPTQQWLKLLETERKIKPNQYAKDIVWPTLALQRLAAARLTVTDQELQEAWETQYGEAIQARLIACATQAEADKVHALAMQNPEQFGNLAKQYSNDKTSASLKGMIQPIRKHLGSKAIEAVAFGLQVGQISDVIAVGEQFVILKCDGRLEPRNVPMDQVRQLLSEAIRDKKLRLAADDLLRELQSKSVVDVVYSDPQRRAQSPEIAARVDSDVITIAQLTEECIERYGEKVLDGVINHTLLDQALRKQNVQISQQDIDAEIARTALSMGKMTPQGTPDVAAWLTDIAAEGLPQDIYIHENVWPTVALMKLVEKTVQIGDEDVQRGFEANFGPRVRCRAIVMNNMRKAQEVWEMARKNCTVETFAELAEKYSIEASTRALRGEIPPIQRWSGQRLLEQEAFALKPGELSGVIQVDQSFVILLCEGFTEPAKVTLDEVREDIRKDIFDKKLRLAMAKEFERLCDEAQIDNLLANTTHSPHGHKLKNSVSLEEDMKKIDAEVAPTSALMPDLPRMNREAPVPRAGSIMQPGSGQGGPAAQQQTIPQQPVKIPARLNVPRGNR